MAEEKPLIASRISKGSTSSSITINDLRTMPKTMLPVSRHLKPRGLLAFATLTSNTRKSSMQAVANAHDPTSLSPIPSRWDAYARTHGKGASARIEARWRRLRLRANPFVAEYDDVDMYYWSHKRWLVWDRRREQLLDKNRGWHGRLSWMLQKWVCASLIGFMGYAAYEKEIDQWVLEARRKTGFLHDE